MCGILGVCFQNGCTITDATEMRHLVQELLIETSLRGTDATGVAYVSRRKIAVLKNPMKARDFVRTKKFNEANRKYIRLDGDGGTISVIGHCRMKTKGEPENNNNNHPIVTNNIVGVHNGVISNDEQLFAKFKGYNAQFGRRGRVDSEIIFRLIEHFKYTQCWDMSKAIMHTARLLNGSFACALIDRSNPFLLWLFRRVNPISIFHYRDCGIVVFSSEPNFIENSVQGFNFKKLLGNPNKITIPAHHGVCINLHSNSRSIFELDEEDDVIEKASKGSFAHGYPL